MAKSSEESTPTLAPGLPSRPSAFSRALGARFRELREERGWSQRELGSRLGVIQSKLSKYESGTHQPSLRTLVRMANIFAVSTDYLLTGTEMPAPPLRDDRLLDRFRRLGAAGDGGDAGNTGEELRAIVLSILDAILALEAHFQDGRVGAVPPRGRKAPGGVRPARPVAWTERQPPAKKLHSLSSRRRPSKT